MAARYAAADVDAEDAPEPSPEDILTLNVGGFVDIYIYVFLI